MRIQPRGHTNMFLIPNLFDFIFFCCLFVVKDLLWSARSKTWLLLNIRFYFNLIIFVSVYYCLISAQEPCCFLRDGQATYCNFQTSWLKKKQKTLINNQYLLYMKKKKNISKTHTAPDTFLIAIYSTSKNLWMIVVVPVWALFWFGMFLPCCQVAKPKMKDM